jgi:hypothetical protein
MESSLPEEYRRAFAKRLQDRKAGTTEIPAGLTKEERDAYNDADLAFTAMNSVNASVKSQSPKYRKAYHERRKHLGEGYQFVFNETNNAEIQQAWDNADASAASGAAAGINPLEEEALRKAANLELNPLVPLAAKVNNELTGEERERALANAASLPNVEELGDNRGGILASATYGIDERVAPLPVVGDAAVPVVPLAPNVAAVPPEQLKSTKVELEDVVEDNDDKSGEITLKYKYDPELGTQIADRKQMILLLKKALKELEADERKQLEGGVKKYPIPKDLYSLLVNIVLNPDIKVEELLKIQFESWNTTRSRTSLFEALWILVIGLGFLEKFPIENIQLVDWRNVNKEQAPEIFRAAGNSSKNENILNILKSMPFGTRAGGVSDITFFFSTNSEELKENPYKEGCGVESCDERQLVKKVFISSVKFFELDIKKNIDKFDIAPLIAATDILTKENKQYRRRLFQQYVP